MGGKKVFYTEIAYVWGLVLLAFGIALMERADFGMSMVVAPAYLAYLKISQFAGWFTFGMAEYCFQAILLVLMSVLLRRFKSMYLFSFCTAVLYGVVLDFCIWIVGYIPGGGLGFRFVFYVIGLLLCSFGVAMFFHTYIAPEAYELFVKEISVQLDKDVAVVKTVYDCCSCGIAVILSFAFFGFGHFEGVKLGTIVCALINGGLIGKISHSFEKHFEFCDALPLKKWFSS